MENPRPPLVLLLLATIFLLGFAEDAVEAEDETAAESFEVTITGDDKMRFDKKVIEVPAGVTVVLTLEHIGKKPKASMGHNFVLLVEGANVDAFALAAARAAKTDYIPERQKRKILAQTRMLGGGESDTIRFPAPPPGRYTYICTFPGHYIPMQGVLIVS